MSAQRDGLNFSELDLASGDLQKEAAASPVGRKVVEYKPVSTIARLDSFEIDFEPDEEGGDFFFADDDDEGDTDEQDLAQEVAESEEDGQEPAEVEAQLVAEDTLAGEEGLSVSGGVGEDADNVDDIGRASFADEQVSHDGLSENETPVSGFGFRDDEDLADTELISPEDIDDLDFSNPVNVADISDEADYEFAGMDFAGAGADDLPPDVSSGESDDDFAIGAGGDFGGLLDDLTKGSGEQKRGGEFAGIEDDDTGSEAVDSDDEDQEDILAEIRPDWDKFRDEINIDLPGISLSRDGDLLEGVGADGSVAGASDEIPEYLAARQKVGAGSAAAGAKSGSKLKAESETGGEDEFEEFSDFADSLDESDNEDDFGDFGGSDMADELDDNAPDMSDMFADTGIDSAGDLGDLFDSAEDMGGSLDADLAGFSGSAEEDDDDSGSLNDELMSDLGISLEDDEGEDDSGFSADDFAGDLDDGTGEADDWMQSGAQGAGDTSWLDADDMSEEDMGNEFSGMLSNTGFNFEEESQGALEGFADSGEYVDNKSELPPEGEAFVRGVKAVTEFFPPVSDLTDATRQWLALLRAMPGRIKQQGLTRSTKDFLDRVHSMMGLQHPLFNFMARKKIDRQVQSEEGGESTGGFDSDDSWGLPAGDLPMPEKNNSSGGDVEDDGWGLGPITKEKDDNFADWNDSTTKPESAESAADESDENYTDELDAASDEPPEDMLPDEEFSFSTADMLMDDEDLGLNDLGSEFGAEAGEFEGGLDGSGAGAKDDADYSGFVGKLRKLRNISYKWCRMSYKLADKYLDFERNWWKMLDFMALLIFTFALAAFVSYFLWHRPA